jgi:uncharacterized damage-inducible protein DinB
MILLCLAQVSHKNKLVYMKLTDHIAQHVIDVHTGDNWTDVNIKNTLENISLQEAVAVTNASVNTIAALLHHITFYNEVALERLKGNNPFIGSSNGFDVPDLNEEKDWMELKKRNVESAQNLAEAIKEFPETKLFEQILPGSSIVYKTLHGVIEHSHYHLGQIVIIKNLLRFQGR